MTIRELKNMINAIDEKYLDEYIYYATEDEEYGQWCDYCAFEVVTMIGGIDRFTITTITNNSALANHTKELDWLEYQEEEENE